MPISYEAYIIGMPKDQALAALKPAAKAQQLEIEEESVAGFFCLEHRTRRQWVLKGPPSRLAVLLESDQQWTIAKVIAWGPYLGGGRQGRLVWRLLVESRLVSCATPVGFAPPSSGDGQTRRPRRAPSWVAWINFSTFAPLILFIPVMVAVIWMGLSLGFWYGLSLLILWVLVIIVAPPLVLEIVPRRILKIRSRRGILANLSWTAGSTAVYFAIFPLVQPIVRWLH